MVLDLYPLMSHIQGMQVCDYQCCSLVHPIRVRDWVAAVRVQDPSPLQLSPKSGISVPENFMILTGKNKEICKGNMSYWREIWSNWREIMICLHGNKYIFYRPAESPLTYLFSQNLLHMGQERAILLCCTLSCILGDDKLIWLIKS